MPHRARGNKVAPIMWVVADGAGGTGCNARTEHFFHAVYLLHAVISVAIDFGA